jgi:hypothetical protein
MSFYRENSVSVGSSWGVVSVIYRLDGDLKIGLAVTWSENIGGRNLLVLRGLRKDFFRKSQLCWRRAVQVGGLRVLEQANKVGFNGLLEGTDSGRLEAEIRLEVLSDLTNQTLEGELSDEELGGLLVTTNLTKSDGTRLVSVGLLDTSGRRGGLSGSLGSKLLTRGLATGGLGQLAMLR